jgi:ABC-type transporter Mla maintaining outer membrane lipid asymmetry ATPase subunit MlaF
MTKPQAAVRFDRVSKRFGSLAVLDDVSFDIPKGKAFCLWEEAAPAKA